MASSSGSSIREGSAKATVADQICQAVQSTSNLLQLMHDSSPSQAHLIKLPKNLLAKASTIKNTGEVLEQLPRIISSLDAYTENSLQSVPHLKTVSQLLSNMESSQIKSLIPAHQIAELNDSNMEKSVEIVQNTSTGLDFLVLMREIEEKKRTASIRFETAASPSKQIRALLSTKMLFQ